MSLSNNCWWISWEQSIQLKFQTCTLTSILLFPAQTNKMTYTYFGFASHWDIALVEVGLRMPRIPLLNTRPTAIPHFTWKPITRRHVFDSADWLIGLHLVFAALFHPSIYAQKTCQAAPSPAHHGTNVCDGTTRYDCCVAMRHRGNGANYSAPEY